MIMTISSLDKRSSAFFDGVLEIELINGREQRLVEPSHARVEVFLSKVGVRHGRLSERDDCLSRSWKEKQTIASTTAAIRLLLATTIAISISGITRRANRYSTQIAAVYFHEADHYIRQAPAV